MKLFKKLLGSVIAASLVFSVANAKTLKVAYDADPVTLDIHEQLSAGMLQHSHMVFDPLVRWNKEHGIDPRLATSWKRVNDTTMVFELRKGVKFHSGNKFTAKDVKYTIERLQKSPDFKAIFAQISSVKVINDYKIEIKTEKAYPLLINTMTYVFPMDSKFYAGKDEITKAGDSFASKNSSGTGPFTVTERQQGVKTVYTAFKGYWDPKKGNVTKVILTPISENGTRTAALLSGDVDFIAPVAPTDFKLIKKNKKTKLITLPGTRIITFHMNQEKNKALSNVKVRQAIVHAINNKAIVKKILKGFGTPAGQMSPAGYQGYNKDLDPRYNLKKAKKLMKEAGYTNGFKLTMMAPNNRYVNDAKIAQAVASMLAKIKIKVELKTMPKAQYWPKFDERAADMMMIGWHSDTEDSANFNEYLTMCPNKETGIGAYNANEYCNKEVDALTNKANAETNLKKRSAMLQKAEAIMYKDAAFVPLHWQNLAWAERKGVNAESILNNMNFPYFGNLVIKK
ncbi:MAG: ABC transporter substrate-binding protein [Alphaproteobacteria bacterium]